MEGNHNLFLVLNTNNPIQISKILCSYTFAYENQYSKVTVNACRASGINLVTSEFSESYPLLIAVLILCVGVVLDSNIQY